MRDDQSPRRPLDLRRTMTDAGRVAELDDRTARKTAADRWWWQFPDGSVVERLARPVARLGAEVGRHVLAGESVAPPAAEREEEWERRRAVEQGIVAVNKRATRLDQGPGHGDRVGSSGLRSRVPTLHADRQRPDGCRAHRQGHAADRGCGRLGRSAQVRSQSRCHREPPPASAAPSYDKALAVVMVACEGAMGKPGKDGVTGSAGPTGPAGPRHLRQRVASAGIGHIDGCTWR